MTEQVNTYFAVLFITVLGAGAASIIVHVANVDITANVYNYDVSYSAPPHKK